jgi:hypothetical protein
VTDVRGPLTVDDELLKVAGRHMVDGEHVAALAAVVEGDRLSGLDSRKHLSGGRELRYDLDRPKDRGCMVFVRWLGEARMCLCFIVWSGETG